MFCAASDGQLFVYTDRIKKLIPFHSLASSLDGEEDKENAGGGGGEAGAAEEISFLRFVAPPVLRSDDDLGASYRLVVITNQCRCFVLKNLLLVDIFKALVGGNMPQVMKLKNQVCIEEEQLQSRGWDVHDVAYSPRRRLEK